VNFVFIVKRNNIDWNDRLSIFDDLYDQRKLASAIAFDQTAIHINPNLAEIHFNLGLAFGKQGRKSDAIAQFQKARPLYQQKGDTKKVADIDRLIQELS
jgi:tetratricopeptide (TPR) repeat protein